MASFSPATILTTRIFNEKIVFLHVAQKSLCRISLHVYIFSLHEEEKIKSVNICTSMPPNTDTQKK